MEHCNYVLLLYMEIDAGNFPVISRGKRSAIPTRPKSGDRSVKSWRAASRRRVATANPAPRLRARVNRTWRHTREDTKCREGGERGGEDSTVEHGLFAFHDHGDDFVVRLSWKLSLRASARAIRLLLLLSDA